LFCYDHFCLCLSSAPLIIILLTYSYRATSKHFSRALRGCWLSWKWKILSYRLRKKQNLYGQKNSDLARWNPMRYMFPSTTYKLGAKLTFYHFILAYFLVLLWSTTVFLVVDNLASCINGDKTCPQLMIEVSFYVAAYQL